MSATAVSGEMTELQLIARAQQAVSQCNWDVGECAAAWTRRFAKGRTDADFANLVGLSSDQIYQRRRVWETFADVREHYPELKWSHFYVALNWEDAAECLQWALDTSATVAEMRAWRRAMRGEDLSVEPEFEDPPWLALDASEVRAPRETDSDPERSVGGTGAREAATATPVAAGFARESSGSSDSDYAPFRPDAAAPPAHEASERPRPAPSIEQLVRRLTTTLERCTAAMNDNFMREFEAVPEKDRKRFLVAARQLAEKLEDFG